VEQSTTSRQLANELTLNIVLLAKVIVSLIVENFSSFYGNRFFFFFLFKRVSLLAKLMEPIVGRDRAVGIATRYRLRSAAQILYSYCASRYGFRDTVLVFVCFSKTYF